MRVPQVSERIKEAPAQVLRGVFAGIGQLLLVTDKLRHKAPADVPHARTPPPPQTGAGSAATGPSAAEPAAAAPAPAAPSRAETAPAKTAPAKTAPAKTASAKPTRVQAAKPTTARDFDKTGNVRLISDDGATAGAAGGIATARAPEPSLTPVDAAPADVTTYADVTTSAGEVADSVPASTAAEDKREDSAPPPTLPPPTLPPPLPNYDELSIASLRARLRSLDVTQVRQLAEYERAHAGRADVIAMFERRIVKLEAEA
jgi:hypothetical protein